MIREAGLKSGLSCTAIFLEEWGTSGKNRPTVRTLLELLIKAEMFRAADYIAVDVLKGGILYIISDTIVSIYSYLRTIFQNLLQKDQIIGWIAKYF